LHWASRLRGPRTYAGKKWKRPVEKEYNLNLLTDALSAYKEVKPTQLCGKLVKFLPPNVIL